MEFVALCARSDINVAILYRLCTAHSYLRHFAQPANKIAYFISEERKRLLSLIKQTAIRA